MDRVIVLGHGKPYDFKQDSGEQIKGVKVSYITEYPSSVVGTKGYNPLQVSLDPIVLTDLKEVPGVYEVNYGVKPGKNNKPEVVVNSFKFIKPVDIESLCK